MNYLQLNFSEIFDKYPKSVKKIISWFASREDLATYIRRENPKANLLEIVTNMVPMIIQHDARKLYEFFDTQDIIISVYQDIHSGNFVWTNSKSHYSSSADSRIEGEVAAFMSAFDYLESNSVD